MAVSPFIERRLQRRRASIVWAQEVELLIDLYRKAGVDDLALPNAKRDTCDVGDNLGLGGRRRTYAVCGVCSWSRVNVPMRAGVYGRTCPECHRAMAAVVEERAKELTGFPVLTYRTRTWTRLRGDEVIHGRPPIGWERLPCGAEYENCYSTILSDDPNEVTCSGCKEKAAAIQEKVNELLRGTA